MAKSVWANLKSDLPAGLVVFIIALPLCLAIVLAGTWAFNVSSPAEGLTAIVFTAITAPDSSETFLAAALIAGITQVALGFKGVGIINTHISEGMLSAIGIIFKQRKFAHLAQNAHVCGNRGNGKR